MARRKDESLINNRKQKKARKVMFVVAFLLTLLCIGTGSYVQELDTVQVGSVAEKRYVAEADAVDEVATNKLKDAAADSVAPIYKQDAAVEEESNAEVKELWLTHFSPAMPNPREYLFVAKEIFPNTKVGKDRMIKEFKFDETE